MMRGGSAVRKALLLAVVLWATWGPAAGGFGASPQLQDADRSVAGGVQTDFWAVVSTAVLNVRTGPGTDHAVRGQVRKGEGLRLLEQRDDWWRIEYQGSDGWVAGRYATLASDPPDPVAGRKAVRLLAARADLLTDPYPGYDVVTTVQAGDALTYVGSREGWVRVAAPDGNRGWLPGPQVLLWDHDVDWAQRCEYAVDVGSWQMTCLPLRSVSAARTSLRTAPGAEAPVRAGLGNGDRLKVVAQQDGWLQVGTVHGLLGWVEAAATAPATAPAAPRLTAAALRVAAPGVLRLELVGDLAGAQVQAAGAGSLRVVLPDGNARRLDLQVAAAGVAGLAVAGEGVSLIFDRRPDVQVLERSAGRLVLELRPLLRSVTARSAGGGTAYRLDLRGDVRPTARGEKGEVLVTLPGARPSMASLPAGVRAEPRGSDLLLRFPARGAHALKRVSEGWDLVLPAPGPAGKVILLDPGHGGGETGAVSPFNGVPEKTINLDVALRLQALLEAQGARVLLTRSADGRALPPAQERALPAGERLRLDLAYRSFLANSQGVDLFVSVHSNASPEPGHHGTEVYYSADNRNAGGSLALAGLVQAQLLRALGRHDGGVKADIFCVTRFTEAPAVLAELAYLNDPEESALLASPAFRQKAAEALAAATAQFFG